MVEKYGFFVILGGLAIVAVAYLWFLIVSFRQRLLWGLANLLFPPAGILFVFKHFDKARRPLMVALVGGLIVGGTFAVSYYESHHMDLGKREKRVEGELHITLTGWDGTDYAILKYKPETVVLQMANADVTDQTLEHLRGMVKLRELDLNDTQVSDAGLQTLAELPQLQVLRLRKTKITDQGFKEHLDAKVSLLELDLRETQVASKTLREWKEKNKDKRKFLR